MPASSIPARNVFNQPLVPCSFEPRTGFFRDGCCRIGAQDVGMHAVCAVMTEDFLEFSLARGNDLVTPMPEWGFRGLRPGDQWCLCIARWREAYLTGIAPPVVLESTNITVLDHIPFDILRRYDSAASG